MSGKEGSSKKGAKPRTKPKSKQKQKLKNKDKGKPRRMRAEAHAPPEESGSQSTSSESKSGDPKSARGAKSTSGAKPRGRQDEPPRKPRPPGPRPSRPKRPEPERQKRSLSNQGGETEVHGPPEIVEPLRRALDATSADPDELTHGFHAYPAKMHPAVAYHLLETVEGTVLDPFSRPSSLRLRPFPRS